MNGLHLIADLYRCHCPPELLKDRAVLETLCVDECRAAGLTPLGAYFYQFTHDDGEKAGVTGTVVLAESHLAIHTWPESGDVTLDVYVCNFSRDNSGRARRVFRRVIDTLKPEDDARHDVIRGRIATEVSP
ncbi:adenosylmethionine decarboxylase [Pseudothauera rhizosphaerae]|uniref:Adenosylmethionine decarboxylase n=1 Tax=Pseudothauera rhizosphaerae TaxID=2565932 RepID=A0A4S4AS64_9RHOO|nr:adenosylmethionine decarboxylase [Pseudothauera rhizosphaerae]THF62028.1 adenosylmethionine decarboxylase [Pseudothauera rhizosphaerae]